MNPLITTVLDLDHALAIHATGAPSTNLLLGGGLGLYLRQEQLRAAGARTLLPLNALPAARTTEDIDLFLRAEVIASPDAVRRHREAITSLSFTSFPGAEWLKFVRLVNGAEVKLDLMVGPLGHHADSVRIKGVRVRPKGLSGARGLHAFSTDDALGIEQKPASITISGQRSDGAVASCAVHIPRAFPYALMKLAALRDRVHDARKQEGRHHAMDLYRIVGMLTEEEETVCAALAAQFRGDPKLDEAIDTVDALFAPTMGSAASGCWSTSATPAPLPTSIRIGSQPSCGACSPSEAAGSGFTPASSVFHHQPPVALMSQPPAATPPRTPRTPALPPTRRAAAPRTRGTAPPRASAVVASLRIRPTRCARSRLSRSPRE